MVGIFVGTPKGLRQWLYRPMEGQQCQSNAVEHVANENCWIKVVREH